MSKVPERVVKAILINHLNGDEFELEEKDGSYCHFLKDGDKLPHVDNFIRFRLDWKDLNSEGDPSLDADIVDGSGKQYKEKLVAHHTSRERDLNTGEYVYRFLQGTTEILFTTQLTMQANQRGTARIIRSSDS
jgi:hypothetical protein